MQKHIVYHIFWKKISVLLNSLFKIKKVNFTEVGLFLVNILRVTCLKNFFKIHVNDVIKLLVSTFFDIQYDVNHYKVV